MEFVKKNILSLLVLVLFLYMMFFGNNGCGKGSQTPDTVYSRHTEYIQQPTQYVPQYQPIIVETKQPVVIPTQYQPSSDPTALRIQFEEMVKKYLAQNRYQDSVILRDSLGNNVGVFRNNDLVSENMIKNRMPSYSLRFPHTTKTITITKPAPLTRQMFLGAELNGGKSSIIRDVGMGAIYKDRKNNLYKFGAGWSIPQQQPYFEIGRYWKLSFKN